MSSTTTAGGDVVSVVVVQCLSLNCVLYFFLGLQSYSPRVSTRSPISSSSPFTLRSLIATKKRSPPSPPLRKKIKCPFESKKKRSSLFFLYSFSQLSQNRVSAPCGRLRFEMQSKRRSWSGVVEFWRMRERRQRYQRNVFFHSPPRRMRDVSALFFLVVTFFSLFFFACREKNRKNNRFESTLPPVSFFIRDWARLTQSLAQLLGLFHVEAHAEASAAAAVDGDDVDGNCADVVGVGVDRVCRL